MGKNLFGMSDSTNKTVTLILLILVGLTIVMRLMGRDFWAFLPDLTKLGEKTSANSEGSTES